MSGDSKSRSISESLVLDDSEKGVVITGITDDTIAAKSGLQAGDEIVAATIHLDHLNKNEVLSILKVLEPYDNNMKVLTKKEMSASAGLGSLGLDLKDPAKMLNLKKDLSLDASAEAPVVSLDGQSGTLNAVKGLGGELSGPTLNGDIPSLSLNKPSADAGAKITMPSLGQIGSDINEDLHGTLKAPDVNVSPPQVNAPSASLNIPKPEIKAGTPKFTMPHFNLPQFKTPEGDTDVDLPSVSAETPDLNLSAPKLDLKSSDLDLNGPKVDLNGPDVNLETQNAAIEAPSTKFKWPKWKSPKVKGPEADLNADLSAPKINGDLDVDADASLGKINWPHMKLKKPKLHSPKADLDIDGNLNTPDVDLSAPKVEGGINLPKADLKGPDLDMQKPDINVEAPSSKNNWFHLKMKKPKADVNTPDLNLSAPKIEAPNVDVQAPDLDTDASHAKFTWPHQRWKKPKLHLPKADMDLNTDLSTPDVDTSVPNIDGEISTLDADMNLPKADVDVKALDADIEAPSGKIRFPTLKKPKFLLSGPKVKSPDVDLDADVKATDLSLSPQASLDGPDVDLNLPKADVDVKTPNAETEALSGKFKWFTLRKQKLSVSDQNVDPKIDGEINAPDGNLSLTKADYEGPKLDINAPDVEGSSGKFKWFKKPKFGTLKGPKADIDDVKVPDIDLKASDVDLNGPDAPNIEGPDLKMSNADVQGPDVDLKSPDLASKLNFPTFKLPNFKGAKANGPELDADFKAPDVDASPNVNLEAPKIEGGFDAPDLDINLPKSEIDASAGKFELPKMNLPTFKGDLSAPDLDLGADLSSPNADVKGTSLDLPTADLKVPDLNLKTSDLSLSSPEIDGNLSVPNKDIKLPKAELEAPDATMKAPNVDINLQKADLKAPDAKLKTPDLDLGDFKLPHFNLPKLGPSSPEVEVPSVHPSTEAGIEAPKVNIGTPTADANISVPVVDLSVPEVEGDIKGPKVDVKAPNADANLEKSKLPHFKFPKFNFPGSHIKAPEVDTSANLEVLPDVKVEAPSVEGEISSPHVSASAPEVKTSLSTPELDITAEADTEVKDSPKSKLRWPFKWGLKTASGTDEEGSGVDSETDVSNAEMDIPVFKIHRLPKSNLDGGIGDIFGLSKLDKEPKDYVVSKGIRLPIVNATSKAGEKIDVMERLKMAKENAPSANASPTEAKTDINLKLAAPSLDASGSTEAGDSSLVRGGTFKVEKPESALDLVAPEILTSDENAKLSESLSNMLGLNIKDSDAD